MAELAFHFMAGVATSVALSSSGGGVSGLAEGLMTVAASQMDSASLRGATSALLLRMFRPLPPPMMPGNWEPASPSCFFGESLTHIVVENVGFVYVFVVHESPRNLVLLLIPSPACAVL